MEAKDLRIGNYVKADVGLAFLQKHVIGAGDFESIEQEIAKVYPIPLTQEWLVKFGFEDVQFSTPRKWKLNNVQVRENFKDRYFVGFKHGVIEIKHVHQLQNLHFALTGEELELKP